jgi:hypothetical protein
VQKSFDKVEQADARTLLFRSIALQQPQQHLRPQQRYAHRSTHLRRHNLCFFP